MQTLFSDLLMLREAHLLSKDWAEHEITCPAHSGLSDSRETWCPCDWPSSLTGSSCTDSSLRLELQERISQPLGLSFK